MNTAEMTVTTLDVLLKSLILIDMINICKKHNKKIKRVLEPSCGSCQIINELDKIYEDIEIDGIEYNNTI